MSEEDSHFVLTILIIYRHIEDYKKANGGDHEINEHPFAVFAGFDGNDEGSFFGFARFVIEKQDKFSEQLTYFDRRINSTVMSRWSTSIKR